jgi:hypothetical protein
VYARENNVLISAKIFTEADNGSPFVGLHARLHLYNDRKPPPPPFSDLIRYWSPAMTSSFKGTVRPDENGLKLVPFGRPFHITAIRFKNKIFILRFFGVLSSDLLNVKSHL